MKTVAFVTAAVAVVLSFHSSAYSQQACGKEYQACMDSCATRSSKGIQEGCFQGCENKNNFCAEKVYGKRPTNAAPVAAQQPPAGPARDAMAKTDGAQEPVQQPAANEPLQPQEQQAEAPQAPKAKAPARQAVDDRQPKRAPVHH